MNIDIVLFAGRIVLVALLYIFLFAVMKTGVGLVRGQRRDSAIWTIDVDKLFTRFKVNSIIKSVLAF